ncbi:MAG: MOSC domain-containing protein [Candidatus Zixiibacteriota bacterium]
MLPDSKVYRISKSEKKGTKKTNAESASLKEDFGMIGDAHAGSSRQVSLLAYESYQVFLASRNDIDEIRPGDFADNITTIGLPVEDIVVGNHIFIGEDIHLEVTELGKSECHYGCPIRRSIGDCIMPREGIFAKVIKGGEFRVGDNIRYSESHVLKSTS